MFLRQIINLQTNRICAGQTNRINQFRHFPVINLPEADKIEKTVFIKAPRSIDYGKVAKLIDAVSLSGANPISLQIDDLP